jgi:hypothetical protein
MHSGPTDRSQAIQIGAVLIFGLLVIMFASYQAFVVPDQNRGIDFNHHQDAERDMVRLRAEILQAKTTGEDRFATVKLGTEYPSRIIARNPPSPSGTLQTTDNKVIEVETADGDTMSDLFSQFEPENRFIEFRPNYVEFREASTIRYENTVVYKDFDESNLVVTNQRLIRGDTISLIPIHRPFQASGRQAASVEPVPGILQREEVEDVNVTLGTELSQATWRDEIFADEIEQNDNLYRENITVQNGNLTLDLTGTFTLEYAPVGLDRAPFGGGRGEENLEINPAAPGDIAIVGADWGNSQVTLTFENTVNATNNFTEGRLPFFNENNQGGPDPEVIEISTDNDNFNTNRMTQPSWAIPDEFKDLDSSITLTGNDTTQVRVRFNTNVNPNNNWFVIEFRLETGQTATYFIGGDFGN